MLTLCYMPWNRCFYSDAEPHRSDTKFAGYSFVLNPPPPELLNHPAYSVEPAFDKLFYEWALILCTLQIGGYVLCKARKSIAHLARIPAKAPADQ